VFLKLRVRTTDSSEQQNVVVRWPDNKNWIGDVCCALETIYKKRKSVAEPNRQHMLEELARQARRIVRHFIHENPQTWALLDARYDFMAILIRIRCNRLVRTI